MKVAIDISQIVYGTGVSVYTKELVRSLLKVAPEHEFLLYAGVFRQSKEIKSFIATLDGSFQLLTLPIPPTVADVIWNRIRVLPIDVFLGNFDVLHTSDWTEPKTRRPKVTTIHDLSPLLYPEFTHPKIRRVFKKKLELVRQERDLCIVPSVSISQELLKLGIESSRIFPIPEAPNPELLDAPRIDVRKRFQITKKYLLMVGTADRKNLSRAIDAFSLVAKKDFQLVIVGSRPEKQSIEPHVLYTGFVNTHELANLYVNAEAFLYPSLYEGFGIPILEAFALKCPVVTSNIGSMQEIAEQAAVLVNPYDTNDIARGITAALKQKSSRVKAGLSIIKKYSWDKTALATLKVYEKAYAEK